MQLPTARAHLGEREEGRIPLHHDILVPLELVRGGEWAEIAELSGDAASVHRLEELGLRCGSRVRMLQPGSPCLVQLGNTRLSLRGDWSMQILVRMLRAAG